MLMTGGGVCTTCGVPDVEVNPMTEQCDNCDSEMDKEEDGDTSADAGTSDNADESEEE